MKKKFLISLLLLFTLFGSIKVYAVETEDLPSKYDLRNDISITVENQKDKPWCSKYAKNKVLETFLQKTRGITYNLSEGYVQYTETRRWKLLYK